METFLLKVLNCPTNDKIFHDVLKKQFNLSSFETLSLESPLTREEDYGFIDVFGLSEAAGGTKYAFIEAKWDFPGAMKQAKDEAEEYAWYYSKYGLFSDDMTKLYHKTVFERTAHVHDPQRKSTFLPLIISPTVVERVSAQQTKDLIADYSRFMGDRICRRVPALQDSIQKILEEGLVPRYPNFVIKNGKAMLVLYCYDFYGNPLAREIAWNEEEKLDRIPVKEKAELNNSQLFSILSNAQGERIFVMHYCLKGYHRPNLFLETEGGNFMCLQHTGMRGFSYAGTYDEKAAFDYEDSLIYSTVLVDRGKYWVTKADDQIIQTQFVERLFHGSIRLSFGASISFTTKLAFENDQPSLSRF
jgi:hypothetical protein